MNTFIAWFQRFLYSHYFLGGLRQAAGVLLPAFLVVGVMQQAAMGMVAAIGAACVAVLDQPGGPRRYGTNGMLAALLLGSLTVAASGLASGHPVLVWAVVPLLCFVFSMFTVFGKQGGLLGFACLLIMTLTMRTPLSPHDVLQHTGWSFLGGVFYLGYSALLHRFLWYREQQQVLASALFATADYMSARARFYDVDLDLEESYRKLIHAQALMTDAHQAARDMILRELPRGRSPHSDALRQKSLDVFVDMVRLLDSLVATHTDYATLRRAIPDSDILLFVRDALRKLALNVSMIALNVARRRHTRERNSVKAELRALEYEMELVRQQGMASEQPEIYALLVQIQRRMRNITRLVDRMAGHSARTEAEPLPEERLRRNRSLNRFLSRQKWRLGMLTSNLRSDSPHFRYATRVAAAALLAMTVAAVLGRMPLLQDVAPGMAAHGYWIILTVIVIMKPGFALTRHRNGLRLTGTLIGCAAALLLFTVAHDTRTLLVILVASSVLGYSFVQVNYMLSAVFNTLFVLLVFHFLVPGSNAVVGERLIDTAIGCVLALSCSYILPSWERNVMASLAQALQRANRQFLEAGLAWAAACRQARASGLDDDRLAMHEADTSWRVARKNVHIAFSNFASAFYRMMDEPVRRQRHVPELNNLLIQHHGLASQISAAIPILTEQDTVPPGIAQALEATRTALDDAGPAVAAPASLETEGELATLAYPLRQMVKAAQLIRHEMQGLQAPGLQAARRKTSRSASEASAA